MATSHSFAPCDDCGRAVRVPDNYPLDWAYCADCHDSGEQYPPLAPEGPWDGIEACYVCGKAHDPSTCGYCDRCGDYHLAELDCAPRSAEPWCNHDAVAVRNGRCECGELVPRRT